MLIQAPIYSDQSGTHFVNMYEESEDGSFRRTQSEPLRQLRDNIKGISRSQGELISNFYDRQERQWRTATVTFHYGRPQSFFYFLRDMVAKNRFYVFSKPQLSGHLSKFDLHELILKNGTSQRHLSLLKEKYIGATGLWNEEELKQKQSQKQRRFNECDSVGKAPINEKLDVDFEQAKTVVIHADNKPAFGLPCSVSQDLSSSSDNSSDSSSDNIAIDRLSTLGHPGNEKPTPFLRRFLFTID